MSEEYAYKAIYEEGPLYGLPAGNNHMTGIAVDAPARRPMVVEELDRMAKTVAELHEVVGVLEKRLEPVVLRRPQNGAKGSPPRAPEEKFPALVGIIMERNAGVAEAVNRVINLLSSLEV